MGRCRRRALRLAAAALCSAFVHTTLRNLVQLGVHTAAHHTQPDLLSHLRANRAAHAPRAEQRSSAARCERRLRALLFNVRKIAQKRADGQGAQDKLVSVLSFARATGYDVVALNELMMDEAKFSSLATAYGFPDTRVLKGSAGSSLALASRRTFVRETTPNPTSWKGGMTHGLLCAALEQNESLHGAGPMSVCVTHISASSDSLRQVGRDTMPSWQLATKLAIRLAHMPS